MKRLLRILFGLTLCPIPMLLGTYIWMWSDGKSWQESVGVFTWYLASGQWNKLPE